MVQPSLYEQAVTLQPARTYSDVLPAVLRVFTLAMMLIVELGNSCTQRFDACSRAIFTPRQRDVDLFGAFEAAFDIVVYLGRPLAEIGPVSGIILKAMFVCTLGTPHDAGRGSGRV